MGDKSGEFGGRGEVKSEDTLTSIILLYKYMFALLKLELGSSVKIMLHFIYVNCELIQRYTEKKKVIFAFEVNVYIWLGEQIFLSIYFVCIGDGVYTHMPI